MEQHSHCVADGVGREVAPGTSFAGSGSTVRLGDLPIHVQRRGHRCAGVGRGRCLVATLACAAGGRALRETGTVFAFLARYYP